MHRGWAVPLDGGGSVWEVRRCSVSLFRAALFVGLIVADWCGAAWEAVRKVSVLQPAMSDMRAGRARRGPMHRSRAMSSVPDCSRCWAHSLRGRPPRPRRCASTYK